MDPIRKYERLVMAHIPKPCEENWDEMAVEGTQRFCETCQHLVQDLSELSAEDAEHYLAKPGRKCVRMIVDLEQGILTREGWIMRQFVARHKYGEGETKGEVRYSPTTMPPDPNDSLSNKSIGVVGLVHSDMDWMEAGSGTESSPLGE